MIQNILSEYGLVVNEDDVKLFGNGLINHTWVVNADGNKYILQRINHHIFKNPVDIANNISAIAAYLSLHYPQYPFTKPQQTKSNEEMVYLPEEGYFRLFPFVKNSHTIDVVNAASEAYEAAKQFGCFNKLLADFPTENLQVTLPDFHNLSLRYKQFEEALELGNEQRIAQAIKTINFLKEQRNIAILYEQICSHKNFKIRVTHHDTKISNVLFNADMKGICVIDLDTVMPGYFISDVGDMMRTYLSPVSEEEKDFSKIEIRNDYFKAIADGYLSEMNEELSATEKKFFVYAGKFMIYMQSLRFLTDYLNNDIYYGAKYEGHNLVRANNQMVLLQKLIEKEIVLQKMVEL